MFLQSTVIMPAAGSQWELWRCGSRSSWEGSTGDPAKGTVTRGRTVIALPARSCRTFAFVAPTEDATLVRKLAFAQLEKRGLTTTGADQTPFDCRVLRRGEGHSVVSVDVLTSEAAAQMAEGDSSLKSRTQEWQCGDAGTGQRLHGLNQTVMDLLIKHLQTWRIPRLDRNTRNDRRSHLTSQRQCPMRKTVNLRNSDQNLALTCIPKGRSDPQNFSCLKDGYAAGLPNFLCQQQDTPCQPSHGLDRTDTQASQRRHRLKVQVQVKSGFHPTV